MPLFVVLILISLTCYVFYKIKYLRSNRPLEKKSLSAKSSISLGLFVCLFGINQLFLYHTTITYIIAAIFILIGGFSSFAGIKAYRHYLPYVAEETKHSGK